MTATWQSPLRFPEAAAITDPTPTLLDRVTRADPARVLVVDGAAGLTGAALRAAVAASQARLRAAGVGRGDVVCVQLPNWWEAVALAHAVWGLGATLCPVPVNYRVAEVSAILAAVPVAAIVAPAEYRGTAYRPLLDGAMERAGVRVPLLTVRAPGHPASFYEFEKGSDPERGPEPGSRTDPELDADLDAVCLLMFTSGTTGRPKGVLHSHRTLLADARSIAGLYRMDGDRVYMPSPVGHVTGLVYGVMMPLLMGGSCVLQAEWDAAAGAALVEQHGCTVCVGATPFLRGLTDEYTRRGQPSALRAFICGGADVPPTLVREAERALGGTVARAYGLTEMPTVTCGGPDDPEAIRAGTDGRLTGTSQARLAAGSDGDTGELEVRGPELCLGYLDPADTAAAFTADGWFRTGDLARLGPDADVTIVGRAKDIVVRGGENISMKEVEDYLAAHPRVADVAIVGVPDDVLGERACAFVVPRDGGAPTLPELAGYLAGQGIARHKLPEYLLIVDAFPRTLSGKIQKFVLRQQAAGLLAAGHGERR
ncbi:MAG: AMP-binding protein [Actinobacteria bacterium]|nr:AMP-binding protein [Actinomycetota bacterium]